MSFAVFKALHLLGAFAWMAAAWYLPRILIYHRESAEKFPQNEAILETFAIMARRLLRYILMPAMGLTWVLGFFSASQSGVMMQPWFHVKLFCVILLTLYSLIMARLSRQFRLGHYSMSSKTLRLLNEVPTFILIAILYTVVVYPAM